MSQTLHSTDDTSSRNDQLAYYQTTLSLFTMTPIVIYSSNPWQMFIITISHYHQVLLLHLSIQVYIEPDSNSLMPLQYLMPNGQDIYVRTAITEIQSLYKKQTLKVHTAKFIYQSVLSDTNSVSFLYFCSVLSHSQDRARRKRMQSQYHANSINTVYMLLYAVPSRNILIVHHNIGVLV